MKPVALELCAGGGGQALGLELAGFHCAAVVEIEPQCCATLRQNRPAWKVVEGDIRKLNGSDYRGVDLLAAGVPCPPFSIAGKQLGSKDERDLFPEALRLIEEAKPTAVLLENVPGFASAKFIGYRKRLLEKLGRLGYEAGWKLLNACDFGVPQLRPRFVLIAVRLPGQKGFDWPDAYGLPKTVGSTLEDLMAANGWPGAAAWAQRADRVAPTIVGGSKKHGGPDLGPTRAKRQWRELAVDAMGVADAAPSGVFPLGGMPRLTVRMVARLQSFPDDWEFTGRKTAAYRQVGNAFPPLVAKAVGISLLEALGAHAVTQRSSPPTRYSLRLFEKESRYGERCPTKVQNN